MRLLLEEGEYFGLECLMDIDRDVIGYRAEAPHPLIRLKKNKLSMKYNPRKIHPDILAILSLVIFYPFIKPYETVSFPEKISVKLAKELKKLPIYSRLQVKEEEVEGPYQKMQDGLIIDADNIDDILRPYQGKGTSLLSFGGGLDSLATSVLFPNMILVHELDDNSSSRGIRVLLHRIEQISGSRHYMVESNSKSLCEPGGWTGWISCIATSLLLATDLGVTNIVLGSSMGSLIGSCLRWREKGYEFPMNSIWSSLLENGLGIKLVTPILGLSEIGLIRIIGNDPSYSALLDYAIWCDRDDGYPCHSCAKCFRRYLLLADYRGTVGSEDWSTYNNLAVRGLLRNMKTVGPTLNYLLRKHADKLPRSCLPSDNSNIIYYDGFNEKILNSWYHRSLTYLPESLRTYVYKRIAERIKPMSTEQMDLFENLLFKAG